MVNVTEEVASKEVAEWLDYKKIFDKSRDESRDSIDFLEEMICQGVLVFNEESHEIKHNLLFPIGEEETVNDITYQPRINDKMLAPYMKGVKATDADGRLIAYIAALTSQARGIIKSLDSQDKKISTAIAVFFL